MVLREMVYEFSRAEEIRAAADSAMVDIFR
jgi:hypothetical protein